MQNKDDILEELRLISELVAGIDRRTPYAAPEGYFDGLSEQVMVRVKRTPYTVPEGYFADFAGKLMARIKAGQEGHAGEELTLLSPLLSGLDKRTPFQAPDGYFSELTGNILSGVQAIDFVNDELENLSPLMTDLQQSNVYEAPEGYFDGLPEAVLSLIKERTAPVVPIRQQSPVISIGRRRKWLQVASAAVVAGLILTAGWLRFYRSAGSVADGKQDPTVSLLARPATWSSRIIWIIKTSLCPRFLPAIVLQQPWMLMIPT